MTNGETPRHLWEGVTPCRVQKKISAVLGSQAIGLEGEKRIGPKVLSGYANETLRIVYQPGALSALKRIKPDVVVGDGFFQWTAFALAYRILYGIPLVVCYERTAYTERKAQWYRSVYRNLVLKFVGAMSCNGKLSKEYAQSLGMDSRRITTGHMVADTDNLKQRAAEINKTQCKDLRASWGTPKMVFLSVGRLVALRDSATVEGVIGSLRWDKCSVYCPVRPGMMYFVR